MQLISVQLLKSAPERYYKVVCHAFLDAILELGLRSPMRSRQNCRRRGRRRASLPPIWMTSAFGTGVLPIDIQGTPDLIRTTKEVPPDMVQNTRRAMVMQGDVASDIY